MNKKQYGSRSKEYSSPYKVPPAKHRGSQLNKAVSNPSISKGAKSATQTNPSSPDQPVISQTSSQKKI